MKEMTVEIETLITFLFKLKAEAKTNDEANGIKKAILCVKHIFQEEPYLSET